ncbi:MAG: RluA family pseudouridine synthase [Firmicutes bacterium]|nr:RluA family pseudouridine synthase [Bacillota bacterium]
MNEKIFLVKEEETGMRLDIFLMEKEPDLTRSRIQNLIRDGLVLANDAQVKTGYKIKAGDRISITIPEVKPADVLPQEMSLTIVYEDEHLAVVNKPRGMVVHPAAGHEDGTLVNGLMYHFRDSLSGINGIMRPGIVHRIDKDTSGLLVICKTDEAHQGISELLSRHDIDRVYHAVVHGKFKQTEGTIDAPIGRMKEDRKKYTVRPDGREAITHYKVLEELGSFSYLEITLETGRTHQIRVHMASLGHPLLGDPLYGPSRETLSKAKELSRMDFWPGQILHAKVLGFIHPVTKEKMLFDSELPDYFQTVLRVLRS